MVIGQPGTPWTPSEVETALEAYFAMLQLHLEAREFSKSEFRTDVAAKLPTRTESSVEMKWSNISAVLDERGLTWLEGYKPLANYQASLAEAVDDWLERNPELQQLIARG
jgi:hypothetical protein